MQLASCEFCEIFKNTSSFIEYLRWLILNFYLHKSESNSADHKVLVNGYTNDTRKTKILGLQWYTLSVKKERWKVTNFLVATNIFPRPKILPD